MKVLFSTLSYYPSIITNESIVVGLLFYNEATKERGFKLTSDWQKVQLFDDELNIDFLKVLLKGIQCKIQANNEPFNIYDFTKGFINELDFRKCL